MYLSKIMMMKVRLKCMVRGSDSAFRVTPVGAAACTLFSSSCSIALWTTCWDGPKVEHQLRVGRFTLLPCSVLWRVNLRLTGYLRAPPLSGSPQDWSRGLPTSRTWTMPGLPLQKVHRWAHHMEVRVSWCELDLIGSWAGRRSPRPLFTLLIKY